MYKRQIIAVRAARTGVQCRAVVCKGVQRLQGSKIFYIDSCSGVQYGAKKGQKEKFSTFTAVFRMKQVIPPDFFYTL